MHFILHSRLKNHILRGLFHALRFSSVRTFASTPSRQKVSVWCLEGWRAVTDCARIFLASFDLLEGVGTHFSMKKRLFWKVGLIPPSPNPQSNAILAIFFLILSKLCQVKNLVLCWGFWPIIQESLLDTVLEFEFGLRLANVWFFVRKCIHYKCMKCLLSNVNNDRELLMIFGESQSIMNICR